MNSETSGFVPIAQPSPSPPFKLTLFIYSTTHTLHKHRMLGKNQHVRRPLVHWLGRQSFFTLLILGLEHEQIHTHFMSPITWLKLQHKLKGELVCVCVVCLEKAQSLDAEQLCCWPTSVFVPGSQDCAAFKVTGKR